MMSESSRTAGGGRTVAAASVPVVRFTFWTTIAQANSNTNNDSLKSKTQRLFTLFVGLISAIPFYFLVIVVAFPTANKFNCSNNSLPTSFGDCCCFFMLFQQIAFLGRHLNKATTTNNHQQPPTTTNNQQRPTTTNNDQQRSTTTNSNQ